MNDFNERLRNARINAGFTQAYVAKNIGVSNALYNKYERTDIRPPYETLVKLCDLFGISVDYLLGRTSNPNTADEIADRLGILDKERTPEEERVYMALQNDDKFRETMMRIYSLPEDVRASFAEFANALIERDRNAKKNK